MMSRLSPPLTFVLALLVALPTLALTAATEDDTQRAVFKPDRSHSRVGFKVRHLGISNVRGSFGEYDMAVAFDGEDLETLSVEAIAETASIDTRNERRDNHLRSDDFFDVEQYPSITFVSKEVTNVEGDRFDLIGDLTMMGITNEVVFQSEFLGFTTQNDRRKAGFEATATINRFDFGLKWDRLTETGGLVVSEDVVIELTMALNEEPSEQ